MPRKISGMRYADSLTREEILEIYQYGKEGKLSLTQLGKKYNISRYIIGKLLRNVIRTVVPREAVNTKYISTKITPVVAQQILDLRREALPLTEIAKRLKISTLSVQSVVHGHKYPEMDRTGVEEAKYKVPTNRQNKRLTREQAKTICDVVNRGNLNQSQIANRYGVTQGYINKIVNGHIYEDISRHDHNVKVNPKKKQHPQLGDRLNRRRNFSARSKGMRYNQFGMLVPCD